MSMWTRLQPSYAANMWNEALNKRLGTEVHKSTTNFTFALFYIGHLLILTGMMVLFEMKLVMGRVNLKFLIKLWNIHGICDRV